MKIKHNSKIKIIGDSLAAGIGSSNVVISKQILFKDKIKKYYRVDSPNSWSSLLDKYLKDNKLNCSITNYGAKGAFSYQINKYLDKLINKDDNLIILLVGINDRKRKNGLNELHKNLNIIINKLKNMNKEIIVLTPNPSTYKNEHLPNRLFHTKEIVDIIKNVCMENKIELIDIYKYITDYLKISNLKIEDIIYEDKCKNDGFHPSNKIQSLIFERIKENISIE